MEGTFTNSDESVSNERYAVSADEAWTWPISYRRRIRNYARMAVLKSSHAILPNNWGGSFVRCLYGHAVFPEQESRFCDYIKGLKNVGEFVNSADLLELATKEGKSGGRYFHISFDDGFSNIQETAAGVLCDEEVPFTVFVATDLVGSSFPKMKKYNDTKLKYGLPVKAMSWDQIRLCIQAGGEIGCHTHTHARLSSIPQDEHSLNQEILRAKEIIENTLSISCNTFAWPFGKTSDISDEALASIKEAGFRMCFSAERGCINSQTDCFQIPRHQIEFHWPDWELQLWSRGFME